MNSRCRDYLWLIFAWSLSAALISLVATASEASANTTRYIVLGWWSLFWHNLAVNAASASRGRG